MSIENGCKAYSVGRKLKPFRGKLSRLKLVPDLLVFDLELTLLSSFGGPLQVALSRLWFILALATLYVTVQGDAVVESGRRRWIDTHWFRGNSYFRIGWEWVKAAFDKGWDLIRFVRFTSHHDPDPAIASRQQHEKRLYRLEFQIQIFVYASA